MGNFYVNTIARAERAALVRALTEEQVSAFVAPRAGGFCCFTDPRSEEQDPAWITRFGARISERLGVPCLTVLNHDDDALALWLFEDGRAAGSWCSDPGVVDDAASGSPAEIAAGIARSVGPAGAEGAIRRVLARRGFLGFGGFRFALSRHRALLKAMDLPVEWAGFGYRYAKAGDIHPRALLEESTEL